MALGPPKTQQYRRPERQGRVPVEGGSIWWRLDGTRHLAGNRLPLIVVHGGPGGSHDYLTGLRDLAHERAVLFYDQLDCGKSDRPMDSSNWRVARFADEIDSLRRAIGGEHFALLGHSWGAAIAVEYAARRPAALGGLVLFSALVSASHWVADNQGHLRALPAEIRSAIKRGEAERRYDAPEYTDALAEFQHLHFNRQACKPPELARLERTLNKALYNAMWGGTGFSASGVLAHHDGTPLLNRIGVPTLYLCGEHDQSTPEANRHFASLTPQGKCVIIPEASHTAHLEEPARFMAQLRKFLRRLDGPETVAERKGKRL